MAFALEAAGTVAGFLFICPNSRTYAIMGKTFRKRGEEMTTFKSLKLPTFIQAALEEINFENLTPVQEQVLQPLRKGDNLIVQSQTGSGKTHAFLIPIIEKIDPSRNEVQAVITAPSRELAVQLYQAAQQLVSHAEEDYVIANYIGGTDKDRQVDRLSNRQPHLVIGTPGRIFDLMRENALWVQTATMMVIDEADMTMDLGFLQIVDEIASRLHKDLQLMVFSATIPQQLAVFVKKYVPNPTHIQIDPDQVIAQDIQNYLIPTRGRDPKDLVYDLLTMGHPYLALVFCNTKTYASEMGDYLKQQGLKVAVLHGDLPPRERKQLMRQIRNLDFQYVVASDLAARGIDIPGVSMVINTQVPKDLSFFIHRVGRTGRNQVAGTAYTLIYPGDDQAIAQLEAKGIEFEEVDLHKGQLKPIASRHRRTRRQDTKKDTDDAVVKAMIGQNKKKKVKPGYKRKLNWEIKEHRRQEAKRQNRAKNRQQRRNNKSKD